MRKFPVAALAALLPLAINAACEDGGGGGSPPAPDAAVVDAGDASTSDAATAPLFDPTKGSFADARNAVVAYVDGGMQALITAPDRFFPLRDPLLVASAISEVLRSGATTDCVNAQFGCPASTSAKALTDEYTANKTALRAGIVKSQAALHAWGRIALSATLLACLDLLEQSKAITTDDVAALVASANALKAALASAATTNVGVYPELSPNAALYRLAFQQIPPAPAPPATALTAANDFIAAAFGKLAIGPKPEDPLAIGPKPEDPLAKVVTRLAKGLTDQGLPLSGTIADGDASSQALDALAYFITVGQGPDVSAVDGYFAAVDALLTKVAAGTVSLADYSTYATATDRLARTFDAAAGATTAVTLTALPPGLVPKPTPAGLEDDPNVLERQPTSVMVSTYAESFLRTSPFVRVTVAGNVRNTVGERRSPIVLPAGITVDLPPRPDLGSAALGPFKGAPKGTVIIAWRQSVATPDGRFDHFDVRVQNRTAKTTPFHKIYRVAADETIAVATALPFDLSWLVPGVNELEVRVSAVDRLGRTSGIVCASLAADATSSNLSPIPPGSGKCFTRGTDLGEGPLTVPPITDGIVIGKYLGAPFRPTLYFGETSFRVYNDSPTPRRLRSLFTPDYPEIPDGIDLALRKDTSNPAGLPPIDTGVIAPASAVDVTFPAGTPSKFAFTLFDADAPQFRARVVKGPLSVPNYW